MWKIIISDKFLIQLKIFIRKLYNFLKQPVYSKREREKKENERLKERLGSVVYQNITHENNHRYIYICKTSRVTKPTQFLSNSYSFGQLNLGKYPLRIC